MSRPFSWVRALVARKGRRTAAATPPPPESAPPADETRLHEEAPLADAAQAPQPSRQAYSPAEPPDDSRREVLKRLDAWLSDVLADEPPPRGIDPEILAALGADTARDAIEPSADRVSLCAALTALTEEIRLQGRAFKQLDESLSPLRGWGDRVARLEQAQRQLADSIQTSLAELRGRAADAERAENRAIAISILDLYDRLKRGRDSCQGCLDRLPPPARQGVLARLLRRGGEDGPARAAVEALAGGYGLTLARLLEALHDLDISPVGEPGAAFDPHTMTAVGTIERDDRPEGTVLEVCGSGFLRRGEMLREAKVVVAARRCVRQSSESSDNPPNPARPGSLVEPKAPASSPPEPAEHAP